MTGPIPPEIQATIDQTIAARRQGEFGLQVLKAGKPQPGVKVKVRLRKHAFLFGCTLPHRDWSEAAQTPDQKHFLRLWEPLFSLVVPENSTKGRMWEANPHFALSIHQWATAKGLAFKSHAPVWGSEIKEHQAGVARDELDRQVRRRLALQFAAFKGNHVCCEVCNELVADPHIQKAFGEDLVAAWYRYAHALDPSVKLSVNEYGQMDDRGPETAALVKKLKEEGVPVSVHGEQFHEPRGAWFPPARVHAMLDRMAANQVEVHLTEITQPDDGSPIVGGRYPGRTWDAQAQAEYYRETFLLGFGHPACESIVLWAFWDGSSWLKRGGIVEQDFTPKPAYQALEGLIRKEWHTELELVTDGEGKARGRGFWGQYELTVEPDGGRVFKASRSLERGGKNTWKVAVR